MENEKKWMIKPKLKELTPEEKVAAKEARAKKTHEEAMKDLGIWQPPVDLENLPPDDVF
jgi:hypothetical protein